ncbi:hypothetical protein [Candidatus Phytoplasma sp. AldY-WA1]|uniref:hypothetical protein n=1 Tax=Candidatus Phytoplasma sp. AldY-WA1 TaxID=2852100 RepID=UPI00254B9E0A|nr:hypothetical protein [Candidatus Phytoplasma sp. AldY-WA1]
MKNKTTNKIKLYNTLIYIYIYFDSILMVTKKTKRLVKKTSLFLFLAKRENKSVIPCR